MLKSLSRHRQHGISALALILIVVVLVLAAWGIWHRLQKRSELRDAAADAAVVSVTTVNPTQAGDGGELTLPGTVEAWTDAPITARTSGYLKRWLVDIGAPVKAGQVLAEIETPEVDEQLQQAVADARTAKANGALADTTATRYKALVAEGLTSQQDADEKLGDAAAKRAAVASSEANVGRLQQLTGFKRVVAPFDGIVTARNVDNGALVTAASTPLFRVADVRRLRVYVQVPQSSAAFIAAGMTATLRLADRPAQKLEAKVVSTSGALSATTRTLTVQLALDNPDGKLLPGVYADVRFKLPPGSGALSLPANTLLFRAEGLQVALLGGDDKVSLRKVTVSRDLGATVEVSEGVAASDAVIINPPDSLTDGQIVRRAPPPEKAGDKPADAPKDGAKDAPKDSTKDAAAAPAKS